MKTKLNSYNARMAAEKKKRVAAMRKLFESGLSYAQIAEKHGISRQRVRGLLLEQ